MRRTILSLAGISSLSLLAACGQADTTETTEPMAETETMAPEGAEAGNVVRAMLTNSEGQPAGEAIIAGTEGGLQLNLTLQNLPAGAHGVHVHQTGDCSADDFSSAGGHWNPTGASHGLEAEGGHHLGDLPNVTVAEDGTATLEYMIEDATISGENALMDDDGAAFVVHEGADDGMTDPAGDSGSRIACGVFEVRQSVANDTAEM